MTRQTFGALLAAAALATLTVGCGDSDDEPASTDAAAGGGDTGAAITIEGFAFSGPVAVEPGATVEVTNLDGAVHTLTSPDGEFNTEQIPSGETTTFVAPSEPGTYDFVCLIHPTMTGSLDVG